MVRINVTKIVKYVCIASVAIVGIVFGSRCIQNGIGMCGKNK